MDVDRVFRDRRKMYEQTGDPHHLAYEKKISAEIRKKGRHNPEVRRNYYVEDTVEQGNFIFRDRLLSCARGKEAPVPTEKLFVGIDWARESDFTWLALVNEKRQVVTWFKYPHGLYSMQIELMKRDLQAAGFLDGRILGVKADDTGVGGHPEILMNEGFLPIGKDSFFKFTMQSKDALYGVYEQALFNEPGSNGRFDYPADHPLAGEFEDQMIALIREYKGDGEYLSVNHPKTPDAKDDAPDATALALLAAAGGAIGEILFA